VSSSRYCDSCDLNVKIGTGGEYNWNGHLARKSPSQRKEKTRTHEAPHIFLLKTAEAGPSSATVEPVRLSSVLDPLLVPTTRSNTQSTLDLFPDAGRCDEDLQSAQLSPAVGEIYPLDFNIDVHQDSDKPVLWRKEPLQVCI